MGSVFSSVLGVEEAFYEPVDRTEDIEVRKYTAHQVARTLADDEDGAFRALAQYIGVWGPPRNLQGVRISMTKPVLIWKQDGHKQMEFILPGGRNPVPVDAQLIKIEEAAEMLCAVIPYKTWIGDGELVKSKLRKLGYAVDASKPWKRAEYSMPSLWILSDTRVWVPLVPAARMRACFAL